MTLENKMILHILVLSLTLSYGAAISKAKCENSQLPITKLINSLGFRLEKMIEDQDNYFFSPLSISVALAMVYIGARGTTREQMAETLEYNIVGKNCIPNKISESFRELIRALQKEGHDYSFLLANGAFIQEGVPISHFYSSHLGRFFNSNIKYVDFNKEEVAAMERINEWVANYTRGRISKLLVEPLDPSTVMVLVNAVYFKGFWDLPFNGNHTRDRLFYGKNNTEKEVPFMILEDTVRHYFDAEKKYYIIELEYVGNNISMIIILPKNLREFPQYELTNELLCELRSKLYFSPVTVMIPKFSMEFKRELSTDMAKMGMADLFSEKADLSGIREDNELHISLMVHKAIIEVNERGSEASAISGIGIDGRNKMAPNEYFIANHPFLFYIIHRGSNTILFSGRVSDP